jgi:hypothetical protein
MGKENLNQGVLLFYATQLGQDEYENVFSIRDKILENSGLKNL